MSHCTREDLLGYLLGALEPPQQEQIELELAHQPELLDELTRLKQSLDRVGLGEDPALFEPPAGLATRTCDAIYKQPAPEIFPAGHGLPKAMRAPTPSGGEARSNFTFADFVAMAAVLVAAAALFFPALASSRFQANVAVCQNRLREIGMALQEYSSHQPDRSFPRIELVGNRNVAGVTAAILMDQKLIDDPRTFVCPTSALARKSTPFIVPTLAQIDAASGEELLLVQELVGGSTGFNIGYQQYGDVRAARDERRPGYALVADAPGYETACRRSLSHDRRGQNVFYEDGHVTFVRGSCAALPDDPFHNIEGRVAAGLHVNDAVIVESSAHPLPLRVRTER